MINRIGIVSDTHDNLEKIDKIIDFFNKEKVDLLIHAGDIISPFIAEKFNKLDMDFVAIFGNNDGEIVGLKNTLKYKIFPDPHIFKVHGIRIIVTHKPEFVGSLEKSGDYDLIVYGHTHKSEIRIGKTIVINPGEGCGYLTGKATVGIVNLENKEAKIYEI